jgi:hypothetical protein
MKKLLAVAMPALILMLTSCVEPPLNPPPSSGPPAIPFFASSVSPSPTVSAPISREEAIKIASQGLRASIVERANITAEIHGWYWEVTFDNISATYSELTPYPVKPPPAGLTGPGAETYAGTYQSIIATVEIAGGFPRSTGARKPPRPGPYIDEPQAFEAARQMIADIRSGSGPDVRIPSAPSEWNGTTKTEAYLQGDIWVLLFWEEGNPEHRWRLTVDAVTGKAQAAGPG